MSRRPVSQGGQSQTHRSQPAGQTSPGPGGLQEGEDISTKRPTKSGQLYPRQSVHAVQKTVAPDRDL